MPGYVTWVIGTGRRLRRAAPAASGGFPRLAARASAPARRSLIRSAAAAWLIAGCMISRWSRALLLAVETAPRVPSHR
jgi:hypothetical protein